MSQSRIMIGIGTPKSHRQPDRIWVFRSLRPGGL